jgi:hypothetical protein
MANGSGSRTLRATDLVADPAPGLALAANHPAPRAHLSDRAASYSTRRHSHVRRQATAVAHDDLVRRHEARKCV